MLNCTRKISGLMKIAMLVFCLLSGSIQSSAEIVSEIYENRMQDLPARDGHYCSYVSEVRWITNCEYSMAELMIKFTEEDELFSICDTFLGGGHNNKLFVFKEKGKKVGYVFPKNDLVRCLKQNKLSKRKQPIEPQVDFLDTVRT